MYIYYVGGFTKSYEIECSKFHTNKKMGQLTFNYAGNHAASFSQIERIEVISADLRIKFDFLPESVMLKDLFSSSMRHKKECVRLLEHFNFKQIERDIFNKDLVTTAMINYLTK